MTFIVTFDLPGNLRCPSIFTRLVVCNKGKGESNINAQKKGSLLILIMKLVQDELGNSPVIALGNKTCQCSFNPCRFHLPNKYEKE